jgi:preprotein translocase subunit SecD
LRERNVGLLIGVIILALAAIWVDLPTNPGLHIHLGPINFDRDIRVHQGLDLQGGMQVLLEADLPEGQELEAGAMDAAKVIVKNRVDALGVAEPLVQSQGERRIIVELPGVKDPQLAIATIRETGLLEFVDAGDTFLPPGTVVRTDFGGTVAPTEEMTSTSEITETTTVTPTVPAGPAPTPAPEQVFHAVLTGRDLNRGGLGIGRKETTGELYIAFELTSEAAPKFADFTSRNVGKYLAIALDKKIISCPVINNAITKGKGVIEGRFTLEEARSLLVQLQYGALPVPLRIETTRSVGPTLGQDSVQRSVRAGAIGLGIVLLFMLVYYRLPGFLADLALIIYALLNFALFKFIPVTLTLPGITGFLLSTGMAVDANILIFERMKEELRWGRSLSAAINAGFDRAWTSIRDSNLSTIITCIILYWFGSNFGASVVKGFAITLLIGVVISMFTAVTVTRTFIRFVFDVFGERLRDRKWLLGI